MTTQEYLEKIMPQEKAYDHPDERIDAKNQVWNACCGLHKKILTKEIEEGRLIMASELPSVEDEESELFKEFPRHTT